MGVGQEEGNEMSVAPHPTLMNGPAPGDERERVPPLAAPGGLKGDLASDVARVVSERSLGIGGGADRRRRA